MIYQGNGVSKGIAIGEIYLYEAFIPHVEESYYDGGEPQCHLERYDRLCAAADKELKEICERLTASDPEKADIFTAHRDILFDEDITEELRDGILYDHMTPEWAIETIFSKYMRRLQKAKDQMIRERAADVNDVKNRLLRIACGLAEQNISSLKKPVIIAAHDLLPSDTATMDRKNVLGILTEVGGETSHSAIIAKSYGIPAILGIAGLMEKVKKGERVILDAVDGKLITYPDAAQETEYLAKKESYAVYQNQVKEYLDKEPLTADGERISIGLNIGSVSPQELEGARYTDFAGLFRSEFLYMESDHLPTEEEQMVQYKKALLEYAPRPVVLRTLDIGGDKTLSYLTLPKEENPFLGKRALRLCFDQPQVFRTQLRAALRASVYGNLWIMLPMVGSLEDIHKAKAIFEGVKEELERENIPYAPQVKLGIMIEIPAVAMIADLVAKEIDFASIGTNDLCQYLTATDRMNPAVTEYYQSYHPSMFRLIGYAARQFEQAGKPLSVCGELGGDPLAAPVLVGLGIRKLSMNIGSVPIVKRALSRLTIPQMEAIAQQVQNISAGEAAAYLKESFAD